MVNLLNGRVWLESTLGRGSTFYVNLPYQVKENEVQESVHPMEFNWENKVILIAEDKKINFEIFSETLSITNVKLIWAKNGKEAVDIINNNEKIDLVLLDIQMPIMDGYECARRIKKISKEIPVIAQTAYALPQDSVKCFEAGCDDYIAKPISFEQLLNKLNKYLS